MILSKIRSFKILLALSPSAVLKGHVTKLIFYSNYKYMFVKNLQTVIFVIIKNIL